MSQAASSAFKPAIYPSLRDRRVLITGGGSGIGASLVEAFARQGARVAFIDIAEADSRALVERLSDCAWRPSFHHCNLTDIERLQATLAAIEAEIGSIQILVNNAANDDRHAIADVSPAYWDDRMAVNLRHLFFCSQAVASGMKAAGGGVILNFGSISWHLALPDIVLYQTAKAGIEGMTRAMARDLGADNIRVNTIVPGAIRTPRQDALWHDAEEEARILSQQCLKARVMPADVAAMALFLASDDARMCTGHSYFIDAGWR
ncbi:SDR family NAD(P)-dependent oxidoreductase [Pedomonas mirosovicensis]|uniref:SDR family NAD(P)-dependent oxidoreductase n=1 Tax=Pedomonas mirosovicensis TaxID=2908641 RepID=UPI0021688771|nr:SDR family oxidoreductase [Pedomonas mirosovicensis]MCH8686199.1 SDR family oxidoreductase [Pedomonas mirosovicensis]